MLGSTGTNPSSIGNENRVGKICAVASLRSFSWSLLPLLIVTFAALTGWLIGYLVPPIGWGCRNWWEFFIYLIWLFSALFERIPFGAHHSLQFGLYFVKDLLCTAVTMGIVIAMQFGLLNRCSCYTPWGVTGFALPEMASVAETLLQRLEGAYPTIVACGIAVHLLIVPGLVIWRLRPAIRVFVRRDDGFSNIQWLYDLF